MMTIITIVCCKCGAYLGEKDGEGVEGVSHGYCPECLKAELIKLQEFNEGMKNVKEG